MLEPDHTVHAFDRSRSLFLVSPLSAPLPDPPPSRAEEGLHRHGDAALGVAVVARRAHEGLDICDDAGGRGLRIALRNRGRESKRPGGQEEHPGYTCRQGGHHDSADKRVHELRRARRSNGQRTAAERMEESEEPLLATRSTARVQRARRDRRVGPEPLGRGDARASP